MKGLYQPLIEAVLPIEDYICIQVVVTNLSGQLFTKQWVFRCFANQPWSHLQMIILRPEGRIQHQVFAVAHRELFPVVQELGRRSPCAKKKVRTGNHPGLLNSIDEQSILRLLNSQTTQKRAVTFTLIQRGWPRWAKRAEEMVPINSLSVRFSIFRATS